MITSQTLRKVRVELDRYVRAEQALVKRVETFQVSFGTGCIESAALKRASLDLSRALTQLRMNPGRSK